MRTKLALAGTLDTVSNAHCLAVRELLPISDANSLVRVVLQVRHAGGYTAASVGCLVWLE